jgi:hypothetical protein
MDMQQGIQHGHAGFHFKDMQRSMDSSKDITWSLDIQQRHDMEHGNAALTWACSTVTKRGHAART